MSRRTVLVSIMVSLATAAAVFAKDPDGISGKWIWNVSSTPVPGANPRGGCTGFGMNCNDLGPKNTLAAPANSSGPGILLDFKLNPSSKVAGKVAIVESLSKINWVKIEDGSFTGGMLTFKTREKKGAGIVESSWTGSVIAGKNLTLRRETRSGPTVTSQTFSLEPAR